MAAQAQSGTAAEPVPLTPDNFARAETDMYFAMFAKRGAFGRFDHLRESSPRRITIGTTRPGTSLRSPRRFGGRERAMPVWAGLGTT